MKRLSLHGIALACLVLTFAPPLAAQAIFTGRLTHPRHAGAKEEALLSGIYAFAAPEDLEAEPTGFRTWETEPAGWYRLSTVAGRHTLLFTQPGHYIRPLIATNIHASAGEKIERRYTPRFDFASLDDGDYDRDRATDYFQTFVAKSKSITQVGFKLATDGVDGAGPGSQTIMVAVHQRPKGESKPPSEWPRVGPATPAVEVDCGGPKSYAYSVGWNSGEVPTTPGETYAVRLCTEKPGGTIQAFWREDEVEPDDCCYRVGPAGPQGVVHRQLWLSVAGDGEGLVIPYNKRVHRQFQTLTHCERQWSQTYVATGRSLAAVVCYAAVSGAQPPLSRQRIVVSVRKGGPEGPFVGKSRVAIGNGNYTGDASWGVFATAFAPGELPLTPGETYAIQMESLENYNTLHGFTNIKGEVSNDKPGFNPYRKHPRDEYEPGTAYLLGKKQDYDLDMQIVEYEACPKDWRLAVDEREDFIANGNMSDADVDEKRLAKWKTFSLVPDSILIRDVEDRRPPLVRRNKVGSGKNYVAQVSADAANKKTCDGGFVQRVEKLDRAETYRLAARVRASWPLDDAHQLMVGHDATGQTDDASAKTIVWTALSKRHGAWHDHVSDPIRPQKDAVSIWLRGRTTAIDPWPFKADFDDVTLRRVNTDAPVVTQTTSQEPSPDVSLPSASEAQPLTSRPKELVVNIDRESSFYVDARKVDRAELEAILARLAADTPGPKTVKIQADKQSPLASTVFVIDLCQRHGIRDYTIATRSSPR